MRRCCKVIVYDDNNEVCTKYLIFFRKDHLLSLILVCRARKAVSVFSLRSNIKKKSTRCYFRCSSVHSAAVSVFESAADASKAVTSVSDPLTVAAVSAPEVVVLLLASSFLTSALASTSMCGLSLEKTSLMVSRYLLVSACDFL